MKRKYVFLAAVAASLAIGCTQVEEISSSGIIYSPTFYASFEDVGGMDTKTYVDNKLTMRWTKDDEVSIFVGNTLNQEYKYAGETGANNGSFNPLTTPGFYAADPLNANYAVYPFSNTNEMDADGGMSLILPAVQHYAENTFGLGANVMVAATKNTSDMMLQFRNLSGYLVLKLYGDETVKSITFEGNNGERISGKAYVTAVSGYFPELDMDETGTTSITLDCGDGISLGSTSATATEFWFCIPPTTFSNGFTITVTNTDGLSMIKSVASSRTIERNMKVSMAALETNCDTMLGNVEFEDANFKAYCVQNFDTDGDGEISIEEAEKVKNISVSTNEITSLAGIEYFTNLTNLFCSISYSSWGQSINGIMHYYDANGNEVVSKLASLDLSKNTALTYLDCSDNQLSSLDVSKNTALTELSCNNNQLTSLDVSGCTALKELSCGNNQLTSIDVSNNTALTSLICNNNQLTSLDVSNNTALTTLWCNNNQLTSLDLSKNTALADLECGGNQLTSLDVSNNTALNYLYCGGNQLTSFDVSKNTALKTLNCYGNQLTSLDVSKNTALADLSCSDNQLTSLDVSNNTALNYLYCGGNQLTSLDVSGCTALNFLYCINNQLSSLDVSNNTALNYLYCGGNQLTSLDVSGCTALTLLYCYDNQLSSLDVSKNTALTELSCNNNQLTSLDVSGCTALNFLYCINNQLSSLDVSNNAALTSLCCGGNQLTSFDVSKNTALTMLYCSNNPYLTEIWLGKDQTISSFSYDINIATVKRYGVWEAVDLGLSVKWASFNLGAEAPWGYGGYYQWGGLQDVTSTSIYLDFSNCPYHTGSDSSTGWTKYVPSDYSSYWSGPGSPDNKTVLDSEDDVAHVVLGGSWRMPTYEEWKELRNNCTWAWATVNGVGGYKVTSNISGYTDKYIFLPAAGYRNSVNLSAVGSYGYYWSSSLYPYSAFTAVSIRFGSDYVGLDGSVRSFGISVRPVCE